MHRSSLRHIVLCLLCAMPIAVPARAAQAPHAVAAERHWIGAWAAAPSSTGAVLRAQNVRQIVRTSLGGSQVRIRVSNLFGRTPLTLGPVRLARHAGGASIVPQTDQAVMFDGAATVTIAAGADALSDPVAFPVTALERLAVSMYVPGHDELATVHRNAIQTAYLATGDATRAVAFPAGETATSRFFLTDVEVAASPDARAVVVVGDSITDGVGSTEEGDARWPDALAARLQAQPALASIAVLNAGIAGNRVLNDGAAPFIGPRILSRFDRDALDKPGVRWIVLLSGNDISAAEILQTPEADVSAQQIIDGLNALVERAHAKGIRIMGATLLPKGSPDEPLTPAAKAKRRAVNAWIRTSGAFDAVVDFERAMRDPERPGYLSPSYDSGDHIHPNDAGYRAMAAAVDLGFFETGR